MQPTLSINAAEFQSVLKQVAAESSRTFPEVVNGQGLALASRAMRNTEKAEASQISHELGQTTQTTSNKGRTRFKWSFASNNTLAHRIVISRLRKAGQAIPSQADIDRIAKRMVAARRKASAFIKSGWIYAIRQLSRVVGYKDRRGQRGDRGARMTGQPKGSARPAQRTLSGIVACEITNTALISEDGSNPMPVAERGLAKAFAESTADMKRHLEEKLSGVFVKYNGR